MNLGEKLKLARTDARLKQSELANILNVSNTTISNWEHNVCKPDLDMISYICDALNVGIPFFLETKVPQDQITLAEVNIIKKYRALDSHGQELIDTILIKEYERVMSEDKIVKMPQNLVPMAAHERTDIEVTEEMRKHDDDIMDQ